mgnify:CR=1 FL=1
MPEVTDNSAEQRSQLVGLPPKWLLALGLLLLLLPLGAGLHMDDYTNIYNAQQADWGLDSLGTSFFHGAGATQDGYLPKGYERPVAYYFRPLLVALFKVEFMFFGLNGFGYHLVNVLFHLANLCLLYVVGLRITGSKRVASWAVILLLFHTPSFAAVSWVSGRTEVCVATVLLLTLYTYGKYRDDGDWLWYVLSIFFCILALGCKEQSVVFPLILVAWDRLVHQERRFTLWPFPFFVPVILSVLYRSTLPGVSQLPPASFYFHPPGTEGFFLHAAGRFFESILALIQLLSHTIIPYGMMVTLPTLMALAAAAGAIVWALWRVVGKATAAPFLAYWIVLFTAPTCMCTQLPLYLYIPTLGAALLLGHLAGSPAERRPAYLLLRLRKWLLVVWVLVGTLMAMGTAAWLSRKHNQQRQLVERVKADAAKVRGSLRVHIFGSSVPLSAIRAYMRLALPKRQPQVHHMTLSSLFLQPRPIEVKWIKRSNKAGSRMIVKEGKRHPFKNWIYGHLHEKPISFTVGDSVATADYSMKLKRSRGEYYWDIYFKTPVQLSWLFYALTPGKVEKIEPPQASPSYKRKTQRRK